MARTNAFNEKNWKKYINVIWDAYLYGRVYPNRHMWKMHMTRAASVRKTYKRNRKSARMWALVCMALVVLYYNKSLKVSSILIRDNRAVAHIYIYEMASWWRHHHIDNIHIPRPSQFRRISLLSRTMQNCAPPPPHRTFWLKI